MSPGHVQTNGSTSVGKFTADLQAEGCEMAAFYLENYAHSLNNYFWRDI